MQATARRLSVVSATSTPRRRLIRGVRLTSTPTLMADFAWPTDDTEAAVLARELFIAEHVAGYRYWLQHGSDLLTQPQPETPYVRKWSDVAKKDRAYREVFQTLTPEQREAVVRLLDDCVRGAVFGALCTLDQFPRGDAEVSISDGVCGAGTRRFRIAPTRVELHDDFISALSGPPASADSQAKT